MMIKVKVRVKLTLTPILYIRAINERDSSLTFIILHSVDSLSELASIIAAIFSIISGYSSSRGTNLA